MTTFQNIQEILAHIGEVGHRVAEMGASEGAAGNVSVCFAEPLDFHYVFSIEETVPLPVPAPHLVGRTLLVSGSGRRLRDLLPDPAGNLGALVVNTDGLTGQLFTSPQRRFARLTSEFNSHLAVHEDICARTGACFHALVHAQPHHLTYLSHISRYQDEPYLNRRLLRWQPETIIQFPQGIACLPFIVPGSTELMQANVVAMRKSRMVIWAHHGVMARSDHSILQACDLVDYAEAAARYEYLNLVNGDMAEGLTPEQIRAICDLWKIDQSVF